LVRQLDLTLAYANLKLRVKKLILPIFAVLISIIFSLPVSAKEPHEVKLDCPKISSTLHFSEGGGASYPCFSFEDDAKVSTTVVNLGGWIDVGLPEDRADPYVPSQGMIADKTDELFIGDVGKIFYLGPPWGEDYPRPYVEYSARLGLCDIRLTGTAHYDYKVEGYDKQPDWQAASKYIVEKLSVAVKEVESSIADECGAKNITGSKNNIQQTEPRQPQSTQNDKKELNDIFSFMPEFNLESIPQFVGTSFIGFNTITDPEQIKETTGIDFQGLLNRKPAISATDEDNAWTGEYKSPGQDDIIVIKGQGQLTSSKSSQAINVGGNDQLPFVTYVDSIFTGATSDMVQLKYAWLVDSGAVVNVAPKTEIKFVKPAPSEAVKEARRMIMLDKGEIEVKVKNDNPENKFGVKTEILDLIVVGTHFWVSHDPDKKQTMVAVYEGKVEVKTKDGKTTIVSPNGDKPGVVVASQKLSVAKLAIGGLVSSIVFGGVIYLLKRKTIRALISKKKTRT